APARRQAPAVTSSARPRTGGPDRTVIRFLAGRLALALPTLVLVSFMVFGLQKLLPGDPATALAGEDRNPEVIAYLRHKYQFHRPIPVQYGAWLGSFVQGDFGMSVRTKLPIRDMVVQSLPITIELSSLSMLIALGLGIPAGVLAALRRGTAGDHAIGM